MSFFLKEILIGLIFGMPVGAVGTRYKNVFSSFAVGMTNPAAILTFLFAFSYFKIADAGIFTGMLLVVGVFIGTYL